MIRNWKALCLLCVLSQAPVYANFFSRLLNPSSGNEVKESAPSGARKATRSDAQVGNQVAFQNGILMAHLSDNQKIPLVGVGVDRSPKEYVGAIVAEAIQDNRRSRLIDTTHVSGNEELIAEGILAGLDKLGLEDGEKVEIHFLTTVWYTHLGYEFTKRSVEDSMMALQSILKNDKVDL